MTTIALVVAGVGDVVTAILDWAGDVVTFVAANPLILFPVLVSFAFVGVRIVKSMVRGV